MPYHYQGFMGILRGGVLPMYQPPLFSENNDKKHTIEYQFDATKEPMVKRMKQVHEDESMEDTLEPTRDDEGSYTDPDMSMEDKLEPTKCNEGGYTDTVRSSNFDKSERPTFIKSKNLRQRRN
jgi:hypothetical protein